MRVASREGVARTRSEKLSMSEMNHVGNSTIELSRAHLRKQSSLTRDTHILAGLSLLRSDQPVKINIMTMSMLSTVPNVQNALV